jgi:hypothetical protein
VRRPARPGEKGRRREVGGDPDMRAPLAVREEGEERVRWADGFNWAGGVWWAAWEKGGVGPAGERVR